MGIDFLETLPVEYLISSKAADRPAAIAHMTTHLKLLQEKLTREQPVLIGHNSLYDICFIYQSFFGPLPATIDKFGEEIHYLFPRIVDTKYLAGREGNHSMVGDDTLVQLYNSAQELALPKVVKDPQMPYVVRGGYGADMAPHQAGYDSKI